MSPPAASASVLCPAAAITGPPPASLTVACAYSIRPRFFSSSYTTKPLLSFFFLRIRPPPSSTLFPYTTLFRSINERWFSSTTKASNGPATTPDEGLSYVHASAGSKFLLKDAVESAGDLLLGSDVMEREKEIGRAHV